MYPAIAIADEIRRMKPESAIMFAGSKGRMEWQAVPAAGYQIAPVTVAGLQRRLSLANLALPFKVVRGFAQSVSLLRAFDADIAVGTGGYTTLPVLAAAATIGIPMVIQEQNAYPGVANRLLARRAKQVHIAFTEAKNHLPPGKCVLSGNPVRSGLRTLPPRAEARRELAMPEDVRVLFVFGGSLGSAAINDVLLENVHRITSDGTWILWQTGKHYFERVRDALGDRPAVRLLPYVDRMDLAYAASDLVLGRAGAITCSELLVTGTPAVLVPSPNVAADHQSVNARSLAEVGAAVHLPEIRLVDELVETLRRLLDDEELRVRMSAAARSMARPDAASAIARAILEVASHGSDAAREGERHG